MSDIGLCVTSRTLPNDGELDALNPAFLRALLYSLDDLDRLLATRRPLLLTLNNECQSVRGDWSGWEQTLAEIARRGRGQVLAVGAGNELDLYNAQNPNDVPPAFAADLARRAAAILRPAGIQTLPTSVAGPHWQEYLRHLTALCGDDVDAVDLHAYGQCPDGFAAPGWGFGDVRVAIARAHELSGGLPVVLSEYGVKLGDAGGEEQQAQFLDRAAATLDGLGVVPYWSWFAWSDTIQTPAEQADPLSGFGLCRADGSRRPAWSTFARLTRSAPIVTPPVIAPPVQERPVPSEEVPVARHEHVVGEGVLATMAARGDRPATCEQYENGPHNSQAEFSRTFGVSGAEYVYLFDTNQTVVVPPEGAQ